MPVNVSWYNEQKTALHYAFSPDWTWDDFYTVKPQADAMIGETAHDVALILDLTESRLGLPTSTLTNIRALLASAHPREKPIILVGSNPLIRTIVLLVGRIFKPLKPLLLFATMEETRAFISNREQ